MAALDDDRENGHIRRIHAWYPRRLRQILRTVLLELLPAFKSHGFTRVIVKPLRDANCLVQLGPLGRLPFLFDVRQIMTHNLYLIRHIRSKSPSGRDWFAAVKILANKQLFSFTLTENFIVDNSNASRSI